MIWADSTPWRARPMAGLNGHTKALGDDDAVVWVPIADAWRLSQRFALLLSTRGAPELTA
jgi:hypothetical protein